MPANNCGAVMRPEKQSEPIRGMTRSYPHAQAVIELAQKGDAKAFEQLYTAHKGRVYSLCVRMTRGNTGFAEELTQEIFLQAYRKIQSFRGESAFSTWLHRITVNAVLMHLRKRVVQEISFEELQPEQQEDAPHAPTKEQFGRYDLHLEGVADRLRLERAIDALPHGYHIIFVLHDIYGCDHQEIAEVLGCTTGNSKSQLHKARISVRKLLQKDSVPAKRISKARAGSMTCSPEIRPLEM